MYKIEALRSNQIEELADFMASSGFLWDDITLLKYLTEVLSSQIEDNVVVTYNGDIVGCNLYLRTLATIKGELRSISWSHSTYLAPEHRRYIGMQFFVTSCTKENIWGFGLTEINRRIHKLNDSIFCGESRAYILTLPTTLAKGICLDYIGAKLNINYDFPNIFVVDGRTFTRCFCSEDHKVPDNGFWNPSVLNADFVRDQNFIRKRFYDYPNGYFVYNVRRDSSYDELYFVFKIRTVNGLPTIFLVDYRFKLSNLHGFATILNSLCHIASINSIDKIYFFTTLPSQYIASKYGTISSYGSKSDIVTNTYGMTENSFLMVTPADADCELIPF